VIRFLLLALLFILVARAFWKLVDSVIEGARGVPASRRGSTPPVKLVRDPVCGTFVPPRPALSVTAAGTTHYFCSERCLNEYGTSHKAHSSSTRRNNL
jgi:YHS domain-containing protein